MKLLSDPCDALRDWVVEAGNSPVAGARFERELRDSRYIVVSLYSVKQPKVTN